MMVVTPVAMAPVPLIAISTWRCLFSLSFCQCFTMPAWESVKAKNAPMAYSEINRSVLPSNMIRITNVNPVSA